MLKLTEEQIAIINHPTGYHAKILAVAGSGKTSTLVYYIHHLVTDLQEDPSSIQVLMFNRFARFQFKERMDKIGIPASLQPRVDTFHSFGSRVTKDLGKRGKLPSSMEYWIEDREEQARLTIHRVINKLEREGRIQEETIDTDEVFQALQLWKGSLIPPPRAGYRGNQDIPIVYQAFEEARMQNNALTYDDFVPVAVAFFEHENNILSQYNSQLKHLIVDEYQDVNYSQQRLIELLAGKSADVVVVGDDDQTIYEWRGARPNFIIREFQSVFDNKPHIIYKLSRSFRFGPVIAQCANNVISINTNRVEKPLISHKPDKEAILDLVEYVQEQNTDANKRLTDQIITLVKNNHVAPNQIRILGRMYAQLSNIQVEFFKRNIPFRIIGQKPFFERREIQVLLDYIRLANIYKKPTTDDSQQLFINIANTPSRMLARKDLTRIMIEAKARGLSPEDALEKWITDPLSSLNDRQQENAIELAGTLERINKFIFYTPKETAHSVLSELIDNVKYLEHFDNYYGKGETSYDRKQTVLNFIEYARTVNLTPLAFIDHISKMDTTHGAPEDQQIVMTSVFKVKGLQFDYVFIPDCIEGYMPCLYETGNRVFDKEGIVLEPEPSEAIENERRLFYVAITRACIGVYIGTTSTVSSSAQKNPLPSKPSRFIDELVYKPTVTVMNAIHRYASDSSKGGKEIEQAFKEFAGNKRVYLSVLSGYMDVIKDPDLRGRLANIIGQSTEIPLTYRFAYSAPELLKSIKTSQEKPLHFSWDDVD